MAAPVISPTTSLNIYARGEYFAIKLTASNTPVSWTCEGTDADGMAVTLAELGLTFTTATGVLRGAFKFAGFYNFTFTATNGDGTSPALTVPTGIEDTGFPVDATIGIEVDVETGGVTRTLAAAPATTAPATAAAPADPVLYGKHACQILLTVTFKKQGQPISLDLIALQLGLKQYEPDPLIDLTDGTFYAVGGGFRLLLDLDDAEVANALGDYETDSQTLFNALAEIRWTHNEQVNDGDPVPLNSRSRNFTFQIERELIPN